MSDGPAAGSHILLPCHLFHHLLRRHGLCRHSLEAEPGRKVWARLTTVRTCQRRARNMGRYSIQGPTAVVYWRPITRAICPRWLRS